MSTENSRLNKFVAHPKYGLGIHFGGETYNNRYGNEIMENDLSLSFQTADLILCIVFLFDTH